MPRLFERAYIGNLELKNRMVMLPMGTILGNQDGTVSQRMIDYYARRAEGGVAMVIVEITEVDPVHFPDRHNIRISDDSFIPGLKALASAIKAHGARAAIQLHHPGRQCKSAATGAQPVAPSPIPCPLIGEEPRELTPEEIRAIVEEYAQATRRANEAGFDAVEFHGAHGYLICQFLSPWANRRNDDYGGDTYRRTRFALDIVAQAREKVGQHFPLIFRFSADEHIDGGLTLGEARVVARLMEEAGVNAISVSAGTYDSFEWVVQPMLFPTGALVPLAADIKRQVKVPVITAGRLGDPRKAERILAEGKADLIGLARPLLADPDLPRKASGGREREIQRCIACNTCMDLVFRRDPIACLMNPETAHEGKVEEVAEKAKRVLVIGGGAAGLEAARVARLRGHEVTLWDASQRLGGRWSWFIRPYVKEQVDRLRSLGVGLELGKRVTAEEVLAFAPEAVLVTPDATPIIPDLPGVGADKVLLADDVLAGRAEAGERVIILGTGNIGLETAEFLRRKGAKVTILGEGPWVGGGLERSVRKVAARNLEKGGVSILTDVTSISIGDEGVSFRDAEGREQSIQANTVVVALGSQPDQTLENALRGEGLEVFPLSFCESPLHAYRASQEGAAIARQL